MVDGLLTDGFISWSELRKVAVAVGPDAVMKSLGHAPLLLVRRERAVGGKTPFLGRCASLRTPPGTTALMLGRSAGVDLRLDLPTVSSRHLALVAGKEWTIIDGSSNGTWVEGVRLERSAPRPLADRETICLADHLWLEFLLPATAAALLARQATSLDFEAVEERAGGPVRTPDILAVSSFMGRIQGTELVDFLQMLDLNRRNGVLSVTWEPDRRAKLTLRKGAIVEAICGSLSGREAALEVTAVRAGMFAFTACEVQGGGAGLPIGPLLLEAARLEDELRRAR